MTPAEKRQAQRIIRNAKHTERRLFNLIEELQSGITDDAEMSWESVTDELRSIQESLPLLFDLVRNIQREVES